MMFGSPSFGHLLCPPGHLAGSLVTSFLPTHHVGISKSFCMGFSRNLNISFCGRTIGFEKHKFEHLRIGLKTRF